jgi:hypothetical protein
MTTTSDPTRLFREARASAGSSAPPNDLPPEVVAMYRRARALMAEGVRLFDTPKSDEFRKIYSALHKGFGRRPWMYHILEVDPDGERPERDYQGRDWEGAVAIRRQLDAAIAT